ncbi:MAG: family 10 glycosylhydrolase [Oscillospiraceae bacterium]|nr:family 10 glycosylhydrolase [Oscillospiraceae bacterium]
MKKTILRILALTLTAAFAFGCAAPSAQKDAKADRQASEFFQTMEYPAIDDDVILPYQDGIAASVSATSVRRPPAEVRAVWISFLEFEHILKNKTERQFTANIQKMFDTSKDFGLNTVIVQVRPFADALYESSHFPWSHTITGTEGKNPGFDPLAIMVREARARGLRIEAWINPYRIRPANRNNPLSSSNQARKWIENGDDSVIRYNGIISYNPASTKAQNLIVAGVVEIVRNYNIDGIHIDDYFYPVTDTAFDKPSYDGYVKNGGGLSLANWRRANVETLIKKMYNAIKQENKNVLFGISPQSSVYNNYHAQYLDVRKITSAPGYFDYICPQIYFGYDNQAQPYRDTLKEWESMVTAPGVKLYVGLAAYKIGRQDSWAGDRGRHEFVRNDDLMKRKTQDARNAKNYGGVVIFRYDSLFEPERDVAQIVNREARNLKSLFL